MGELKSRIDSDRRKISELDHAEIFTQEVSWKISRGKEKKKWKKERKTLTKETKPDRHDF